VDLFVFPGEEFVDAGLRILLKLLDARDGIGKDRLKAAAGTRGGAGGRN
jgi:hypothetical protein